MVSPSPLDGGQSSMLTHPFGRVCLRILISRACLRTLPGLSLTVEPMAALLVERATHPAGPHPSE